MSNLLTIRTCNNIVTNKHFYACFSVLEPRLQFNDAAKVKRECDILFWCRSCCFHFPVEGTPSQMIKQKTSEDADTNWDLPPWHVDELVFFVLRLWRTTHVVALQPHTWNAVRSNGDVHLGHCIQDGGTIWPLPQNDSHFYWINSKLMRMHQVVGRRNYTLKVYLWAQHLVFLLNTLKKWLYLLNREVLWVTLRWKLCCFLFHSSYINAQLRLKNTPVLDVSCFEEGLWALIHLTCKVLKLYFRMLKLDGGRKMQFLWEVLPGLVRSVLKVKWRDEESAGAAVRANTEKLWVLHFVWSNR